MNEHERWYSVDAESARLFRLGEWLEKGAHLGLSPAYAKPVLAEESGQVVNIQYDIGQHELILVLDSGSRRQVRSTARPSRDANAGSRRRAVLTQQMQQRQKEELSLAGGPIR